MRYGLRFILTSVFVTPLACAPICAQLPSTAWINVTDYGAKGDGTGDDSPAVLRAVQAAVSRGAGGGEVVYFPPTRAYYRLETPLNLPPTNYWVTLVLDGPIALGSTLEMGSFYAIRGDSGGSAEAFSTRPLGLIGVLPGVSPPIHIQARGDVLLQDVQIKYVTQGDGIVVDSDASTRGQPANVTLDDVHVDLSSTNISGTPLVVKGGFSFHIIGGSYATPPGNSNPSMSFEDDTNVCNSMGIVRVSGTFLAGTGIRLKANCANVSSVAIGDVLYESGRGPFLTIDAVGNAQVFGVTIHDINMSDDQVRPLPVLVDVHGSRVYGITITNSQTNGPYLTSGDTIHGLEIWSPKDGVKVAQSSEYILHEPSGTVWAVQTWWPGRLTGPRVFVPMIEPPSAGSRDRQ